MDFIHLPPSVCDKVNKFGSTSFSQKFITRIFAVLLRDSHRYVGSNTDDRWNSGYLISKRIYNFDHIKFLKDLRFKLGPGPIRKTDSIWNFDSILSSYSKERDQSQDGGIIQSLRKIVDQEFDYLMLSEDGIVIPRNAIKTIPEYLEEAFDHLGYDPRGHTVDEISDFLTERYPCQDWNKSSISGNLSAGSRQFKALGKTGAFLHKKWLDDRADIIMGKIPEVALEILKREPMPLNIIQLTEKMSRYRRNMDIKSVTSYISKKPGIAQRESFYGNDKNSSHSSFLQLLKPSKGNVANWKKYDGKPISMLYQEMMEKGFPREQIDYMLDLKKADGQIEILGENIFYLTPGAKGSWQTINPSIQPPKRPSKPQKSKNDLIAKLKALETNGFSPAKVRFEQLLLRSILFFGMRDCTCAICGRKFPVNLLVAAHIHKRSLCTELERRDPYAVMATCTFGCDILFEKGILFVNENGIISANRNTTRCEEVTKHLQLCVGNTCTYHAQQSRKYFSMHRALHQLA